MPNTASVASFNDSTGSLVPGASYYGPARDVSVGNSVDGGVPGRYATSLVVTSNPTNPATVKILGCQDASIQPGEESRPQPPGGSLFGWALIDQFAAPGGSQVTKEVKVTHRWVRVLVVNGAVAQTVTVTTDFRE
jgi:hypothetical protein